MVWFLTDDIKVQRTFSDILWHLHVLYTGIYPDESVCVCVCKCIHVLKHKTQRWKSNIQFNTLFSINRLDPKELSHLSFCSFNSLLFSCERSEFDPSTNVTAPMLPYTDTNSLSQLHSNLQGNFQSETLSSKSRRPRTM